MDFALLLTGIAIGVAVSAPLGPVNLLVVRNAIRRGFGVALLVGLGAVAADVVYAAAAAYGISAVSHLIAAHARGLMVAGGLLLVVVGIGLARKRVALSGLEAPEPLSGMNVAARLLGAFGLTLGNPGELFGFIAIFGSMNGVLRLHEAAARPPTVILGVALGGVLWWLFLSFLVSRLKQRFSDTALARINRWTAILVAAFGFALLMEALG